MRRPKPKAKTQAPAYPNRAEGHHHEGRRRFLKQLGASVTGASFAATLGLPKLSHGQSLEVNFGLLEAHPSHAAVTEGVAANAATGTLDQAVAAMPAEPMAAAPPAALAAPPSESPIPAAPAAPAVPALGPADGVGPDQPISTDPIGDDRLAANPDWVVEDRALWVDPGYLVLVRLSRPPSNLEVIEAFDGSTEAVSNYLGLNVGSWDDLHDVQVLHSHEVAIAQIIADRILPASIDVLHLDHDCNTVCGALTPPEGDPGRIPLPGMMPPPGF